MTIATRRAWDGGFTIDFDTAGGDFQPAVVPAPASVRAGEKVSAAFAIDSATVTGTEVAVTQRTVSKAYQRHRIIVSGKDVTYFRGVQTPMPSYSLVSPLLFGPGQITFPQIHAVYERPGFGELTWLRKFSRVIVQRVDADDNVVATDYRGFIADYSHEGRTLTCSLGGQAEGRAAMMDRPVPIFPRPIDIGAQGIRTVRQRLHLSVGPEPDTGIVLTESGGGSQLDFLTDLLAKSTMRDGTQWTIMPNANDVYRMFQKDTTTIGLTLYIDGYRVTESLRRDFTEEPNRVWAQATVDGMRVRPAWLPGLVTGAREAFPGDMSPGDDGTADFELLRWQLSFMGYLDGVPPPDVWTTATDDPVTDAVMDLQDDAGLSQTGVVDSATWDALWDEDVTGVSLRGSTERPAAQRSYTKEYLRAASGRILGRNPAYDKTRPPVDVSLSDMGALDAPQQLFKFARRVLADENTSNWVGTITVNTGAVIDGEHNPGDPLDSTMIREARSVKPGQNAWLPTWDGGTLVHISGVNVLSADSVELTVDTRARDTMPVWQVINRNRESRKSPDRQWIAQNRRSGMRENTGAWYDGRMFGKVARTFCPANVWTVLMVVAGRSGTLQKIDIQTSDSEALFGMAVFGKNVDADWCNRQMGNPFAKGYEKNLKKNERDWRENHWLVDVWGTKDQPCGYWPEALDPNAFNLDSDTGTADASTDTLHVDTHGYYNGQKVYFHSGSVPAGLTADNDYYVIQATTNTFKVSATQGGSAMNITADATGVIVSIHVADVPPVTGEFRTDVGVTYYCKNDPVLYVPIRPDRDTYVNGGRILTLLLDDSAS